MVPGLISAGTTGRTYVKALVGSETPASADPDKWQDDAEILRCNPLCSISDRFRDRLLAERDAALKDELACSWLNVATRGLSNRSGNAYPQVLRLPLERASAD